MIPSEKADLMKTTLAFVKAVHNQHWGDAGYLCRTMMYGDSDDPMGNFATSLAAMATLLCNELDVTDEWFDVRVAAINYLEIHPDA